jgi:hypothetical protein
MTGNKTIHRLIMILCIFVLFHWIMLLILNYVPLGSCEWASEIRGCIETFVIASEN